MSLAICTMVKDEEPYLAEFLAFHALAGVSHFRVYDNGSTDSTLALLARLSTHYNIEVLPWTVAGIERQQSAFNDACRALAGRYDWVAAIDADEFLYDPQCRKLDRVLGAYPADVGAVAVNQRVFGSAGLTEIDDADLVIRRFNRRAPVEYHENFWIKTIVRPECLSSFQFSHSVHLRRGRYIMTDGSVREVSGTHPGKATRVAAHGPVLHHYILKSWGEYQRKQRRGAVSDRPDMKRLTNDYFTGRDASISVEPDDALVVMAELVQARMRFADWATRAPDGPGQALTPLDRVLSLPELAGHSGFLPADSAKLFWLRANETGTLVVNIERTEMRLGLGVFMITADYPLDRMVITVNGAPVEFAMRALGEQWRIVETATMPMRRGRNEIMLALPVFLRIRDAIPGSQDPRSMAIALTEIRLITEP